MKKCLFILAFLFVFIHVKAQSLTTKYNILSKVFDELVNAYGNPKGKPDLVLIPLSEKESYCIAGYFASPKPTIKVDEKLYDICTSMGADSLNAISIILSHELAHYYNDHNWCSDFAFAIRNTTLGKKIIAETKSNNLSHEREADNFGLYHSCIAGFRPFGVDSSLLEKLYWTYELPQKMIGYPTKAERIGICKEVEKNVRDLYPIFRAGVGLLHIKNYSIAADCFQYLSRYFPSREVYNNLGVCKLFEALDYSEYDSLKFIYPIEVDPISRMFQSVNRGAGKAEKEAMQRQLFQESKTALEKALSLDPQYIPALINLACLYDAKQNYQSALGTVSEISSYTSYSVDVKLIEAIALYHSGDKSKSASIFSELAETNNPLFVYNNELSKFGKKAKSVLEIESWKDEWMLKHTKLPIKACGYNDKLPIDSSNTITLNEDLIVKSIAYPSYEKMVILNNKKKIVITTEKCSKESLLIDQTKFPVLRENECFQFVSNGDCWLLNYHIQYDQ